MDEAEASGTPIIGMEQMSTAGASSHSQLDNWFTYHDASPHQVTQYNSIRAAARALAEAILINAPPSADRSDAIRKVREAVMTANAAIACGGW